MTTLRTLFGPIIVSHPNACGYTQNCTIEELSHYLARYPGGFLDFFYEAVNHVLTCDLPGFMEKATKVYQDAFLPIVQADAITRAQSDKEYRIFRHRILDMWLYAKTSMLGVHEYGTHFNVTVAYVDRNDENLILLIR